jgi:glycerol kinase
MNRPPYVLALDAGTSSSRALLFDATGQAIATAQREFTQYFPREGWVEHDPEEIWATQLDAMREVIARVNPTDIAALGITNQRETTVVWERCTGKPVYPAIVWQDKRTAHVCAEIDEHHGPLFRQRTGLLPDPYFSGTKLAWILRQHPDHPARAQKGELLFGTIDTWLIWKLTGGTVHATDASNASRTLMFDIHRNKWDPELLDILGIPGGMLPAVHDSSGVIGHTRPEFTGHAIPIAGIAGDQQAALFGQLCHTPGMVKNTYGTGCFCMMNTGSQAHESTHRLLTTIAWRLNGQTTYALEGGVFVAGALIQWLRDQLGLVKTAPEIEQLAHTVADNGGITFIPALSGLGAPYWRPEATGAILGITRGTQPGHIARAALEAIALSSAELIEAMQRDSHFNIPLLKVDGGASRNDLLMQMQADFLDTPVVRPQQTETTALGAAFLAGLATGVWGNVAELQGLQREVRVFEPQSPEVSRRMPVRLQWNQNMKRMLQDVS